MSPFSPEVREILDNVPDLTKTQIRSYSKDYLVDAVLELGRMLSAEKSSKVHTEVEVELARLEVEKMRLQKDIASSVRAADFMESIIKDYGLEVKEHKYGPSSTARMIEAASQIASGVKPANSNPEDEPVPFEDSELEKRVEKAVSQGLRWNSSNTRPERRSTVLKKIERWEGSYLKGKLVDPSDVVRKSYEEVLKDSGKCESYVVGVCETIEEYLGIGPTSKYLKTRFNRDISKYSKVKGINSVYVKEEDSPSIDLDSICNDLVEKFMGTEISSTHQAHCIRTAKKYIGWAEMHWNEVDIDMFRKMVSGHKPVGLVYNTSSGVEPSVPEVFQAVVVKRLYDDQLRAFWDKFCEEKGLING